MCGTSGSLRIRKIPWRQPPWAGSFPLYSLPSSPPSPCPRDFLPCLCSFAYMASCSGDAINPMIIATEGDRAQVVRRSQEVPCIIGQCLGDTWPFSGPDQRGCQCQSLIGSSGRGRDFTPGFCFLAVLTSLGTCWRCTISVSTLEPLSEPILCCQAQCHWEVTYNDWILVWVGSLGPWCCTIPWFKEAVHGSQRMLEGSWSNYLIRNSLQWQPIHSYGDGLSPFMRAECSWSNYLLKGILLNTDTLEKLHFQAMNLEYTFKPSSLLNQSLWLIIWAQEFLKQWEKAGISENRVEFSTTSYWGNHPDSSWILYIKVAPNSDRNPWT